MAFESKGNPAANAGLDEEEDASNLVFGAGFDTASFLCNGEVAVLLQAAKEGNPDRESNPVFMQALNYATTFSGDTSREQLESLRSALVALRFDKVDSEGHIIELKLEQYEIAALMNLFPRDVAVAIKLIPSLAKLDEHQVRDVLSELELVKSEHSFD